MSFSRLPAWRGLNPWEVASVRARKATSYNPLLSSSPPISPPPLPPQTSTAVDPDAPHGALVLSETEALEQAEGSIRSGKLAGKTMWQAIWILALPVLFQQAMAACVGLVDKMLAGSLPSDVVVPAMDAISIGTFIGWFINIAMAGLGVGGQVLIARGMGSGDLATGHRALGQSVILSVVWGAFIGLAMWLIAEPLGRFSGLSDQATVFCRQYVGTIALSMPFCGLMMVGSMCLHGAGETTKPSIIAIVVNVVNIIFAWLLSGVDLKIGEWFVVPKLTAIDPSTFGVIGIGAGTAISWMVGGLLTLAVLRRGVKDLRLTGADLRPDGSMCWRMTRVGVPNFLEGIAMWAVNLFVMNFIGQIALRQAVEGEPKEGLIGAHLITVQWEAISFLPGFAMGTAAGALAGQYLGAGNARMARRAILACTWCAVTFMGLMGLVFIFEGEPLTMLISRQEIHVRHVPNLLILCGLVQVFFAIVMVLRQGLRGAGDANWTLFITFVSCYFVRLPAAYILGVSLGFGIEGVWMALCGELVIRAGLFALRFFHGGWQTIRV